MLKVFEAFSGVGAQQMALRNLNVEHEIVATSDIDSAAIKAYAYIHNPEYMGSNLNIDINIAKNHLIDLNIISNKKIDKIKKNDIIELYKACICSKNLGDITKIDLNNIPDHDLFTYSFPCQDISSVGKLKGLQENSGTRSSLLWECKRIIENKKPKFLLLENVQNLVRGKNKDSFEQWLEYLNDIGYKNTWKILDSKNFGIPQRRPRVFVVSKLKEEGSLEILDKKIKMKSIYDILDKSNETYDIYTNKIDVDIKHGEYKFFDDRDWCMNGIMISDICSTQRAGRSGLKCIRNENGELQIRKLSDLECWRLMGFSDIDYNNLKKFNFPSTSILKLCGNSIVVNVLEGIFENMLKEDIYD